MHSPLASLQREDAIAIVILYTTGLSENEIVTKISYQMLQSGRGLTPSIKKTLFTFLVKKKKWKMKLSEKSIFFKNARNLVLIVVLSLKSKVPYLFVHSMICADASVPNRILLTVFYRFGLTRVLKCFSRTVLERALC